ncbi:hypothetical protein BDL97_15G008600 [Sphagnum fallax]|jgi:hypothetical protein|nr:hypothetical protein BDL97_15G008600 [Sphagnum fallax]
MAANYQLAAVVSLVLMLVLRADIKVVVAESGVDAAKNFFQQLLPSVSIPATLRTSLSPLEGTFTADRFATAVTHGVILPATTASFCKAAGLICQEDIDISPYTSQEAISSAVTTQAGQRQAHAASRAMGIKTINDFQFDFFLEEQLVKGGSMNLVENLHDPIPKRAFLPFVVADSLPSLTSANLPKLLQTFNIGEGTKMATIMSTAVYLCESPALMGEERACPTSIESMAEFVSSQVGTNVEALTTTGAPSTAPSRNAPVKILDFTKRSLKEGEHIVICHNLMFPSQLYYCHHVTGTKVVQASLQAAVDSSVIHAIAICHMDTSMWASEHPAFAALNIPRGAEACHWIGQNDLVWVPTR